MTGPVIWVHVCHVSQVDSHRSKRDKVGSSQSFRPMQISHVGRALHLNIVFTGQV